MLLIDALDLLASSMDAIFDAAVRVDANALVVQGRFLQAKFGHACVGAAVSRAARDGGLRSAMESRGPDRRAARGLGRDRHTPAAAATRWTVGDPTSSAVKFPGIGARNGNAPPGATGPRAGRQSRELPVEAPREPPPAEPAPDPPRRRRASRSCSPSSTR